MHVPNSNQPTSASLLPVLDFVWLELTNKCNLQCTHCYTESGPRTGDKDVLTENDYLDLIDQLSELGCRKIQFIGGEPTLNKSLLKLIQAASEKAFEFIEVFTNLTRLSDELLSTFQVFHVSVATSFYSHRPETHDAITGQIGSFDRTVCNILRVLDVRLPLRVGLIAMEANRLHLAETMEFLRKLGVENIGTDHVRKLGRAADEGLCQLGELCGSCSGNILSIGPNGVVAPCNMSRFWPVGSVLEKSLQEIVASSALSDLRRQIGHATAEKQQRSIEASCTPKSCNPYESCCPSTQQCFPCAPNGCTPCRPKG
jgi:MoaA/NifB/PqqE/SkfB family radical SAM enzyme